MEELKEITAARSDNNESITFKISVSDKQKLLSKASDLGMTLSEYIRIKLVLSEDELHAIIKENKDLKEKAKVSLVKQHSISSDSIHGDKLIIQTTKAGKEALTILLDVVKHQKRIMPKGYLDDFNIGCILSIMISDRLSRLLGEMEDFRSKYGISQIEQFYKLLFEPYFSQVYPNYSDWDDEVDQT